nr:hypothetical protein [Lachnospiraceae bacterium]
PWLTTADLVPSMGLARISFLEIRPGDIGMEALPGASDNHIGYFVGFDADGRAKWVHCSSGSGGVAVNNATCFRYYYRLFDN